MLGLTKKIGGAELTIDAIVGNDESFCRARQEINTDTSEQLPLCFRDVSVAWAHDHIDSRNRLSAECHCRNGLNAAKRIDFIGAAVDAWRPRWPDADFR